MLLVSPKDNSLDTITLSVIFHSLWTETSVFLHHGTKLSDYGILKPERSLDNSLDTRKKFSPYASPPIIDKLSLLVLIRKLNYGTLLPIANIHLNLTTIKTGSPKLDILLIWSPQPNPTSTPTSPLSDGTEDSRFGTPISKLEILSNPIMAKLTQWLFPPTPNIWPPEVKTRS